MAEERGGYCSAEGGHAEVVEVCEEGDAAVLGSVMKGDLHSAEVIVLPAADAPQHVVCQPPLPAVPCTAPPELLAKAFGRDRSLSLLAPFATTDASSNVQIICRRQSQHAEILQLSALNFPTASRRPGA